jgi:hypothetical protein
VLGISIFDLIGSLAYIFDILLLPAGSSIPGAMGNSGTCKLQGVLIQLGLTSVIFNFLLAMYFWLSVSKGWKEHQFKKVRFPIYCLVVLIWAGLAFGGIPLYEPALYICALPIPPFADSWTAIMIFVFVPFSLCILGITLATIALFQSVYKLERSSSKWRLEKRDRGDSMTEKVFWRCFWYLLAVYVPWPMFFASYFVDLTEGNYAFWIAMQICIPIQGILNWLVYYQRSIGTSIKKSRVSLKKVKMGVSVRMNQQWMQPADPAQNTYPSTGTTHRTISSFPETSNIEHTSNSATYETSNEMRVEAFSPNEGTSNRATHETSNEIRSEANLPNEDTSNRATYETSNEMRVEAFSQNEDTSNSATNETSNEIRSSDAFSPNEHTSNSATYETSNEIRSEANLPNEDTLNSATYETSNEIRSEAFSPNEDTSNNATYETSNEMRSEAFSPNEHTSNSATYKSISMAGCVPALRHKSDEINIEEG